MANETSQQYSDHAERVKSQNTIQESVKKFLDKIFLNRKNLAKDIADFTELGSSPEKIQKVKDAARQQELAIAEVAAEILKKKQEEHSTSFAKSPNPYADLDATAKRIKNEDSLQSQSQEKLRKTQEALDALDEATDLQAIYACLNALKNEGYVFTMDQHGNPLSVTPEELREKIVEAVFQSTKSENHTPQGILNLASGIPQISDIHYKVLFDLTKDMKNNQGWLSVDYPQNLLAGLYKYGVETGDPLFNFDMKKSDSYSSPEPAIDEAIPKEKSEPKSEQKVAEPPPKRERMFSPEDLLTPTQRQRQKDINKGVDTLRVRYSQDNPALWIDIASHPLFSLLDVKNIIDPKRKEAEAWFDGLMADLDVLKKQAEYDQKVKDAAIWLTDLEVKRSEYKSQDTSESDAYPYYKLLGVSKNATEDQIKKAFKFLSTLYHPDIFNKYVTLNGKIGEKVRSEQAVSAEKFKEINDAYRTLSDAGERRRYEEFEFYRQKVQAEEEARKSAKQRSNQQSGSRPPDAERYQSDKQENRSREQQQALVNLDNAHNISSLKNALRELARLGYQFYKDSVGNNPYDVQTVYAATVIESIESLESLIKKGTYDINKFNAALENIPSARKVREKVSNELAPIRSDLEELDSFDVGKDRILEILTNLESRNYLISIIKDNGEVGTRSPAEIKKSINDVYSQFDRGLIRSPQALLDAVNDLTTLCMLNLKVLFDLKRRFANDARWQYVQIPPRVEIRLNEFMQKTGNRIFK